MKSYNLKIILLSFGLVFLSSCTRLLYTSLDVLKPAKVEFRADATKLLILNNSVIQPLNYGHRITLLNDKKLQTDVKTDSLAIYCLSAFAEELENKAFFSSVQLSRNSINKSAEFLRPEKLSQDSATKICRSTGNDVILTLDRIKVNDDQDEFFLSDNLTYINSLEAKYETIWSIHYPDNSKSNSVTFKDTLYWETESVSRRKAMNDMPKREDALIDGALEVGRKCVNRFTPYWEKVNRYFFDVRNKEMKRGMDSVYVKNWKSAIDIWTAFYNKSNDTFLVAQAANNIAIAYEITGDLDKALEFATKSYYAFGKLSFNDNNHSFTRVSDYILELNQRKKEIEILKKQLGEK